MNIRSAALSDTEQILKIYNPYITDTVITFELKPLTTEEFRRRMESILAKHPFFVCETDGSNGTKKIIGYAYASKYRDFAAFEWSVIVTVYIDPEHHRKGIGKALYKALFDELTRRGYYNAYAAITDSNDVSIKMHENMGFSEVGTLENVAYKHGQWRGVVWMKKQLHEYDEPKPTIMPL